MLACGADWLVRLDFHIQRLLSFVLIVTFTGSLSSSQAHTQKQTTAQCPG